MDCCYTLIFLAEEVEFFELVCLYLIILISFESCWQEHRLMFCEWLWLELVVREIRMICFWLCGHRQYLTLSHCGLYFHSSVTALFEAILPLYKPGLQPLDSSNLQAHSRCFYSPSSKVKKDLSIPSSTQFSASDSSCCPEHWLYVVTYLYYFKLQSFSTWGDMAISIIPNVGNIWAMKLP